MKNKKLKNYYISYTILFAIIATVAFVYFIISQKSMIWVDKTGVKDGLVQHFNALAYYGSYLREIVRNLFENGKLIVPMWDFKIGLGSDILTTFHYYVIGDPLNLLSVFVPKAYTEYLYDFLIILRLYLAGLTFSAFARHTGQSKFATLAGSFIYSFCSFALYAGVRHPFFLNPMIYLPLILLGVEYIFGNKRPYIFILSIFLAALSNFYFFYMLSFVVVIYAAIRFFMHYKDKYISSFFKCLVKFGSFYIVGVLMASIIFIPIVLAMLSTNRGESTGGSVELLYELDYYRKLICSFISSAGIGEWTFIGSAPIAFTAVVMLFSQKNKAKTPLKIGFIALSIFLLFPIFGYTFNGFAYVSNRWSWAYSFLIALIFSYEVENFSKMTKKQWWIVLSSTIIYILVSFTIGKNPHYGSFAVLIIGTIIILTLVKQRNKIKNYRQIFNVLIIAIIISGIGVNAFTRYSEVAGDYVSQFLDIDDAMHKLKNTPEQDLVELKDDSFYRYEVNQTNNDYLVRNASLQTGGFSTIYYFSLGNPNVYDYITDISDKNTLEQDIRGFDGKTIPETLASVKYFITDEMSKNNKPYGFSDTPTKSVTVNDNMVGSLRYDYYVNNNALPLGYTYSSYKLTKDYDKLTAIEKQQAMLDSVIVDKKPSKIAKSKNKKYDDENLSYTLNNADGIIIDNNKFIVTKDDATITMNFNGIENAENYLSFNGFKYSGVDIIDDIKNNKKLSDLPDKTIKSLNKKYADLTEPTNSKITMTSGDIKKSFRVHTPSYTWYNDRSDFDLNLCYSKEKRNEIQLIFERTGVYYFDDINVVALPMDNYNSKINNLKNEVLENVNLTANKITGTINLSQDKFLLLTIPYTSGWTAYVDGKPVELEQANVTYMGLQLEKGNHKIELKYFTPNLKYSILATIVGTAIFIGIITVTEIKRKKDFNK